MGLVTHIVAMMLMIYMMGHKTMTTIFRDDVYPTFGFENECANGGISRGWSPSRWQDELNNACFDWVVAKPDGTHEVDVEFITPPFSLCDAAKSDIAELFPSHDQGALHIQP